MFVRPDQYQSVVAKVVAEEPCLDVAVAFWGEGAGVQIHPEISKPIRMIVNLRSGGTNPWMIDDLRKLAAEHPHIKIKQCDRLHAKVIVGDSNLVAGSANLSRNGLGLEGQELAHWLEAAIHTTRLDEVQAAKEWFQQLWASGETSPITDADVKDAILAYKRNRKARPDYSPRGPFTFSKYQPYELEGRDAYALLYAYRPSKEAEAAGDQHHQLIVSEQGTEQVASPSRHWVFESWPDELDTSDKNEYLCLYLKKNGGVKVDGACKMTGLRFPFDYHDERGEGWIDLATPAQTLLDHSLRNSQLSKLAREMSPVIDEIWHRAEKFNKWGAIIHLSEISRILSRHMRGCT